MAQPNTAGGIQNLGLPYWSWWLGLGLHNRELPSFQASVVMPASVCPKKPCCGHGRDGLGLVKRQLAVYTAQFRIV